MGSDSVSIYFDYASPYSYFCSERLPAFQRLVEAEVEWRPIRLMALSHFSSGLPYSPNRIRYNLADVPRSADFYGIPIQIPSKFPIDSERALRLALVANAEPGFPTLHRGLFAAVWAKDQDIGATHVLAEHLAEAGMDVDSWLERIESPEVESQLEAFTRDADSAGVFGVPTASYGGELYWGNDRLPMLESRLAEE